MYNTNTLEHLQSGVIIMEEGGGLINVMVVKGGVFYGPRDITVYGGFLW